MRETHQLLTRDKLASDESPASWPMLLLAAVVTSAVACSSAGLRTEVWWINSFRVPCVGVAPMQCLQVHGDEQPFGEWRLFYDDIAGFEYQPGSLYRVKIRRTEVPADRLPADASSLRYGLLEIIEQRPDPRAPLHDIYMLEATGSGNTKRDHPASAQATIEFNIVLGRYAGNDGCREFHGAINDLDGERLSLAPPIIIDGVCARDSQTTALLLHLADIAMWRRDGLLLELLDASGERQLLFRKVD